MKVLTILSRLEMGGVEKTLLSCIPYLKLKGIEVSILCSKGGSLDQEFESLGVKLIDFGKNKKALLDAKYLKTILYNEDYDIVHSRYGHTSGLFAKVCKDADVPFIVSIHNERAMFRNNWIGRPVLGFMRSSYLKYHKYLTLKYATKIVGHSKANLRYYKNDVNSLHSDEQFEVLYNGVDFSKFNKGDWREEESRELDSYLSGANKVLIHIGSFKEQKNHRFLIDVFLRLKPIENRLVLILLGGGALLQPLKSYARDLGLEKNIFFAGIRNNIEPYLKASDIFVFPSLYEGFGNVLIEAQYLNLPIAASAISPHFEATYKGYHDYTYHPTNIDDARIKIEKLLADDLSQHKIEARHFAEGFTVENMVENLAKLYSKILSK